MAVQVIGSCGRLHGGGIVIGIEGVIASPRQFSCVEIAYQTPRMQLAISRQCLLEFVFFFFSYPEIGKNINVSRLHNIIPAPHE
jgi:hypothetical protein